MSRRCFACYLGDHKNCLPANCGCDHPDDAEERRKKRLLDRERVRVAKEIAEVSR